MTCIIGQYCRTHGFIHGAEAEELRERIEKLLDQVDLDLINNMDDDDTLKLARVLRSLLDDVDARDSVAFLEHRDAPVSVSPDLEICICAAIQCDDGTIIRGHRHDDCILTAGKMGKGYTRQDMQGFVTSRNRYVSREQGARLMREALYISPTTGLPFQHDMLFSEDLY